MVVVAAAAVVIVVDVSVKCQADRQRWELPRDKSGRALQGQGERAALGGERTMRAADAVWYDRGRCNSAHRQLDCMCIRSKARTHA